MRAVVRPGAVIFTGNVKRLGRFYEALTGLPVQVSDDSVCVLASEDFELVLHALPGEPEGASTAPRDSYVKPFFPVTSLARARELVTTLGGQASSVSEEWSARGFSACEAVDPDGNPIQLREAVP